jgi:hypothetical protein
VSPTTAILPQGWEQRIVRLCNSNTGGATGLCVDVHDLALSKYAAGREKDLAFNRELARHSVVGKRKLIRLLKLMPLDDERKSLVIARIKADFAAVALPNRSAPRHP